MSVRIELYLFLCGLNPPIPRGSCAAPLRYVCILVAPCFKKSFKIRGVNPWLRDVRQKIKKMPLWYPGGTLLQKIF